MNQTGRNSDEESDEESGGYDLDACPSGCDQVT